MLKILSMGGLLIVGLFVMGSIVDARSRLSAEGDLVEAGRTLFRGMEAYMVTLGSYPSNGDPLEVTFDRESLEPLIREGSLDGSYEITSQLKDAEVSIYCSPDLPTTNDDFWAILVSEEDPTLKVMAADTDQYPGREGERLRGVYLLRNGTWVSRGL